MTDLDALERLRAECATERWVGIPDSRVAAFLAALHTDLPAMIAELRAARQDAARYRRIQNIAWGDGQGNWTFYMSDFVQSAKAAP